MTMLGQVNPLVEVPSLSAEQQARLAEASLGLQPYLADVAAEVAGRIRTEVPEFVYPYGHTLESLVESVIGYFVAAMADPDLPRDTIADIAQQVGASEAAEGRSLDSLQAAMRIGAGATIGLLTEHALGLGLAANVREAGQIAQAVFTFTDKVIDIAAAGHAEQQARAAGRRLQRRHDLLDALVDTDTTPAQIKELAQAARWPLPRTVAVVAVRPDGQAPVLPPDALLGYHLDPPLIVMPDPAGPGRRNLLEKGLAGRAAVIGPVVPLADAPLSLRWAHLVLDLVTRNVIEADRLVEAADHLPLLLLAQEPDLVESLAARRFAVLDGERPAIRDNLIRTLATLIEHRFNAPAAAAYLQTHPQTIRHRLRKLEHLFGASLHDPARQLELHLLTHAYLASPHPPP